MNQLYNGIFHRKSIRKYNLEPLSKEALEDIKAYAKGIKPLDDKIAYEFTFLESKEVKNLFPIKAPHYVCIYSEKKEHYLMNAGFILQEIDLYLSTKGIGCCWLGMAKPSKDIPIKRNGMDFVIMLAFGNPIEPLYRDQVDEFKRKPLSDISQIKEGEALLEPVRLSPSATNSQPWFFSGTINDIIVSREKLGLIKAAIYNNLNQIDVGICLKHLELAAANMEKKTQFIFEKEPCPKGYEFMARVKISS